MKRVQGSSLRQKTTPGLQRNQTILVLGKTACCTPSPTNQATTHHKPYHNTNTSTPKPSQMDMPYIGNTNIN